MSFHFWTPQSDLDKRVCWLPDAFVLFQTFPLKFAPFFQITNRFFQAIPAEGVKQHLMKIFVDTMLEAKDVVIGNAAKNSLLKVHC